VITKHVNGIRPAMPNQQTHERPVAGAAVLREFMSFFSPRSALADNNNANCVINEPFIDFRKSQQEAPQALRKSFSAISPHNPSQTNSVHFAREQIAAFDVAQCNAGRLLQRLALRASIHGLVSFVDDRKQDELSAYGCRGQKLER